MNTYVALVNWTDKGVQEVQESPARIQKARAAIAAAGGEMKSVYVTLGRCDMIAVIEAPDDAAYTRVMLNLASKGGVRTESLRIWDLLLNGFVALHLHEVLERDSGWHFRVDGPAMFSKVGRVRVRIPRLVPVSYTRSGYGPGGKARVEPGSA